MSLGAILKIAKSDYWLCHICLFIRPSVHMEQRDAHWRIFKKFDIWVFFEYMARNFKLHYNLRRQDWYKNIFIV